MAGGSAKHWANISGGDTVSDSFNQSSIVDNSGSDCTYNINSNMSNGVYASTAMACFAISNNPYRTLGLFGTDPTSGLFRTHGFHDLTMPTNDMETSMVSTNGDLA